MPPILFSSWAKVQLAKRMASLNWIVRVKRRSDIAWGRPFVSLRDCCPNSTRGQKKVVIVVRMRTNVYKLIHTPSRRPVRTGPSR